MGLCLRPRWPEDRLLHDRRRPFRQEEKGTHMARHQSKLIVLTGATRGLGQAMVQKFIELGHVVFGCGRSREGVETLRRMFGAPHDFAAVNVAREDQVEPWAARLLSNRGAPNLLINNAGVINENAPLWCVPA